jgi:hypothetical protein
MSDDEFEDSELDNQDMLDLLDNHEKGLITPYQSPVKKRDNTPASARSHVAQPNEPKEPDFTDPSIVAALEEAESQVIALPTPTNNDPSNNTEVVTLTRAGLEAIKRNAFTAGRNHAHKPAAPFPFLSLPAELRLVFYSHYFHDRNPATSGTRASALPSRLSDHTHCCASTNTWCKTPRPWISTALLRTCQQIYHEARDDFLYKYRMFSAPVGRMDGSFKEIRPHLRFWQYIQHLDLEISAKNNCSARYETGSLVIHLVALLRGGQYLKSFQLKYAATGRVESITRFKDLSVKGKVSLTQVFKDWSEPGEHEEAERRERLERLLFSILGCACKCFRLPLPSRLDGRMARIFVLACNNSLILTWQTAYDAPPYDVIASTTMSEIEPELDLPFYETYMTISTSDD